MVNMREHSDILYWYLGSKKNILNSFECSLNPLKQFSNFAHETDMCAIYKNASKYMTIAYTRQTKTKHKHNTICVGPHYTKTNTNNVNKTFSPHTNNFLCRNLNRHHNMELQT